MQGTIDPRNFIKGLILIIWQAEGAALLCARQFLEKTKTREMGSKPLFCVKYALGYWNWPKFRLLEALERSIGHLSANRSDCKKSLFHSYLLLDWLMSPIWQFLGRRCALLCPVRSPHVTDAWAVLERPLEWVGAIREGKKGRFLVIFFRVSRLWRQF